MQDRAPESRRPHCPHPHSSIPTPVSETAPPGSPSLQLPLHCHPHSLLEVSLFLCSHVNSELGFYSSCLSASVPVLRTSGPHLTQTLSVGHNHALPASTPPHRPAVVSAPVAVCPLGTLGHASPRNQPCPSGGLLAHVALFSCVSASAPRAHRSSQSGLRPTGTRENLLASCPRFPRGRAVCVPLLVLRGLGLEVNWP